MGEYLREMRRRRSEQTRQPGPLRRAGVSGLVVVLAVSGLAFLVAALVRLSPLAVAGALVAVGSALLWWLSDRVGERPDGSAGRFFRDMAEVKFAACSITSFLIAVFLWLLGMIKGW